MTAKPAFDVEINLSKQDLEAIASGSAVSTNLEHELAIVRVKMISKEESEVINAAN